MVKKEELVADPWKRIHLIVNHNNVVDLLIRGSTRLGRTPMSWIVFSEDPLDGQEQGCQWVIVKRIHLIVDNGNVVVLPERGST